MIFNIRMEQNFYQTIAAFRKFGNGNNNVCCINIQNQFVRAIHGRNPLVITSSFIFQILFFLHKNYL